MNFRKHKSGDETVSTSQPIEGVGQTGLGRDRIKLQKPGVGKKGIALMVLILLVMAGFGFYFYWYNLEPEPPKDRNDELAYREYILKHRDYEPTYADYMIIGNEYQERKQYKKAEEQFKKAESMSPDKLDVAYALANINRLQRDKSESLEYYEKVISTALDEKIDEAVIEIYKAERESVKSGDFELKNVEYPNEMPT